MSKENTTALDARYRALVEESLDLIIKLVEALDAHSNAVKQTGADYSSIGAIAHTKEALKAELELLAPKAANPSGQLVAQLLNSNGQPISTEPLKEPAQ